MVKRYTVTVDDKLDKMLDSIDGLGEQKATKIINIVRAWMAEKSIISTQAKEYLKREVKKIKK